MRWGASKFIWLLTLTSCADGQPPPERVRGCAVSAIYGGFDARPIGMTALEATAIVMVEPLTGEVACTGVLIDDHTVLTAAHCVPGDVSELLVRMEQAEGSTALPVVDIELPSAADLALLRLAPEPLRDLAITPIPVASAALPERHGAQLAVIAGFGVSRRHSSIDASGSFSLPSKRRLTTGSRREPLKRAARVSATPEGRFFGVMRGVF